MKTKKNTDTTFFMKLKKAIRNLFAINLNSWIYNSLLTLLTLGASLIIGLLSFGGFWALWPILPLALTASILSFAYESEIFFRNTKGAIQKLMPGYVKMELARAYLRDYFPLDRPEETWPRFFVRYKTILRKLHALEHQRPSASNREKKKQLEQKLADMEQAFAEQLHAFGTPQKPLARDMQELHDYLQNYKKTDDATPTAPESLPKKYQEALKKRQKIVYGIQAFCILATLFMGLGSTYLLMETFTAIPFLMALPVAMLPGLILPMAIISGIAYGLLTYNTMTNIVANDTFNKRYQKLRHDIKTNGFTFQNVSMALAAIGLCLIAIGLTLCTAGTWWTIAKNTRPLFSWMSRMPAFIMRILTPLITSISALAFNLENSSESIEMFEEATQDKTPRFKQFWHAIKALVTKLRAEENIVQLLNPFRLILALTIVPLRIALFLGHLASIGFTTDRAGSSKFLCLLLASFGTASEGLEDIHYFSSFGEDKNDILYFLHIFGQKKHQHDLETLLSERLSSNDGHSHSLDLPTRLLMFVALPVYALSALWSYVTSQFNAPETRLTWGMAFNNVYDVFGLTRKFPSRKPGPQPKGAASAFEQSTATPQATRSNHAPASANTHAADATSTPMHTATPPASQTTSASSSHKRARRRPAGMTFMDPACACCTPDATPLHTNRAAKQSNEAQESTPKPPKRTASHRRAGASAYQFFRPFAMDQCGVCEEDAPSNDTTSPLTGLLPTAYLTTFSL